MKENLYKTMYNDVDYTILNPSTVDWSTYKWEMGYTEYEVDEQDILKPYIISVLHYGTVEYEDIILLLNNIPNPFEMRVGLILRIPDLEEFKQFMLKVQQDR